MIGLQVKTNPKYRDVKGRFAIATEAQKRANRGYVERQAQRYQDIVREEAPRKSGKLRASLKTHVFTRGNLIGFDLEAPEPLTTFIVKGTKPHIIRARQARALRFYWPKVGMTTFVPKKGGFRTHVRGGALWIGKGYVEHPGTKANPFIGRAFRRWLPGARADMEQVAKTFVRVMDGQSRTIGT